MQSLERCPMCPSRNLPPDEQKTPVGGDLCIGSECFGIAEGPGKEENNRHRIFVGKAGDELNNTYCQRAGLTRDTMSLTNSVKCHWADSGDAPPDWLVKSCSEFHLRGELARVKPQVVILMGGTANSLMGWDVDQEHGIMHEDCELLGWRGRIYSTFHPALGLHMSSKMQALLDDFSDLRKYLRGELQPLKSACPSPEYYRLRFGFETKQVFESYDNFEIAVDTESKKTWRGYKSTIRYTPDRLTFCVEPPSAYMIMRSDSSAIEQFAKYFRRFRRVYMHNMPHDDWACTQMGIYTPVDRVFDTMSGAYHDGRLAKGLKYLAYRLAGIRMTSFDDVVVPYSYERALEYLSEACLLNLPGVVQEWTGEMVERNCPDCRGKGVMSVGRGKTRKVYACDCSKGGLGIYGDEKIGKVMAKQMTRSQSLNQAISRLFTDARKGDVKIWERWESWSEKPHLWDAFKALMDKLGPLPLPSIEYVPEDRAMVYACGDALATRIIGPIVRQRVAGIRRSVRG